MKMWQKTLALAFVGLAAGALSGCEDEEANDLARAQACMDKIRSANYADAANCMPMIAKYNSQQANILKCSISFLQGGLTTEKVSEAYKQIATNSVTVNNEAVFITVLALDDPADATSAQLYCQRSGLKGLIYLANLAVIGSTLASFIDDVGYDPLDPSTVDDVVVNEAIDDCKPPSVDCGATEYATIGNSIITISETYCVGENADAGVCTSVAEAIAGAGGDPEIIAQQLLCKYSTPSLNFDPDAGGPGIGGCVP